MTRIAKLLKGYYVNFDDHGLYSAENKKIAEINKRPLEVLEYLSSYPNCYKQNEDINQYLDEGCLSSVTIRNYIFKLRAYDPILRKVVLHNSDGYKYIGGKIENIDGSENPSESVVEIEDFIKSYEKYEEGFLKSIMSCDCKWGACTLDEIPQNANTCEGILALIPSNQNNRYKDVIDDAMEYLERECSEVGLISKSLDIETVVPTSMFLCLCSKLKRYGDRINPIAEQLWKVRSKGGWGIYVRNMGKYSNIGCTYWALMGLSNNVCISKNEIQKYLKSLFKYEGAYKYGKSIDDIGPRIPNLYATAMMYILYNLLSEDSKRSIGTRYNPDKALEYIIENFDNPFFLVEQEGIEGIELNGHTSVHTVNWNHISINYSMTAIAVAISNGLLAESEIETVLKRIVKVIDENCESNQGLLFWASPNMSINRGARGKMIFPTMQFLMGLSTIVTAIKKIKEK